MPAMRIEAATDVMGFTQQLFEYAGWKQVQARLKFLIDHRGAGLLTGEVGSGKSTAARTWLAGLNPNLFKVIYLHWSSGSPLDFLRQIAGALDLEPAHYRGDLTNQISEAVLRLHKTRKQLSRWKSRSGNLRRKRKATVQGRKPTKPAGRTGSNR